MPYDFDWYIEGRVVSGNLWGVQTLDELVESNEKINGLLDDSTGVLTHLLINDEQLDEIPTNLLAVRKTLTYANHPKLGWVVMIGTKKRGVKDYLIELLAKIARARYCRFPTFEDAVEHLKKVDQSINWNDAVVR